MATDAASACNAAGYHKQCLSECMSRYYLLGGSAFWVLMCVQRLSDADERICEAIAIQVFSAISFDTCARSCNVCRSVRC